jgi:hypothetical protein
MRSKILKVSKRLLGFELELTPDVLLPMVRVVRVHVVLVVW